MYMLQLSRSVEDGMWGRDVGVRRGAVSLSDRGREGGREGGRGGRRGEGGMCGCCMFGIY
jgi:hypothetical protein